MFMSKNRLIFNVIILFLIPVAYAKTCKSIQIRNSVQSLEKLRNCTEIRGDLYIVLIQTTESEADYDPYVYPELKIVTGYVVFFKLKHLTSLGKLFPNLRLIRGLTLFMNYALIMYDLPNLQEIGTSKLSNIARGYVKIGKTPKLCYVDSINWRQIGDSLFPRYQKYRNDCPPCPERCNGWCWNKNDCQVFNDNCHMECLGCSKYNSSSHCEVCRNYEFDEDCVAECPSDRYSLDVNAKCITQKECMDIKRDDQTKSSKNRFVYQRECRKECPEETDYNPELNTCVPCGNKCTKWCNSAVLIDEIGIRNMKGCTHINGSLTIRNLHEMEWRLSLYESFKSLKYIKDYLVIGRNDIIEDLLFLPKLSYIAGEKLYGNKTFMVFENRELAKLWDSGSNFTLKINGSVGFHDNERLCKREITTMLTKSGIRYSDTDVSENSNGIFCYEDVDNNLQVNTSVIKSENVTLTWERKHGENEVYYTVHYTTKKQANNTIIEREENACSNTNWIVFATSNNSAQLTGLNKYTVYYYYIVTYLQTQNGTSTRYSTMKTFKTLADDPDKIFVYAKSVDHQSIRLTWTMPSRTNGNLSKYEIYYYKEDLDHDLVKERDYCLHPVTEQGAKVDTTEVNDLRPEEVTSPSKTCGSVSEEINIKFENNPLLCDLHSQSKNGVNYCKNYYYEQFSKRSAQDFKKAKTKFSRVTIPASNETTHVITSLTPFSLYVFFMYACNEEVEGRKLCSSIISTYARTEKDPEADTVPNFTPKGNKFDIFVTWTQPDHPNGLILAYKIYYRRDIEHSKNQTECITHDKFIKDRNVTLRNLLPGGYFLMVQAISLAGPGKISFEKYIELGEQGFNPLWLILSVVFVLVLSIIAMVLYIRFKRRSILDNIQLIPRINPDYITASYEVDEWEMDREDIDLIRIVGQGTFGRVYLGLIKSKNMHCAVKTVNEEASQHEVVRFLEEARTMKEFANGTHVVKLYGVVSMTLPPLVIMELMERGDLKRYLYRIRESSETITSNEIYRMAIEIADGLCYLTSRKFVHRDLAARNCMVSTDRTVKIGDFGMTRDIYQSDYYKKGSGKALLPVRWMAPEAIADGVNSCDSDIWSYGIVLWEICTLACQPYQGLSNEAVTQFVVSKGTLDRPTECPNLLWEIMRKCWDWYPTRRPTCFEIVDLLQNQVGPDFKMLSFYHSDVGQDYLNSHASDRPINLPAVPTGHFHYEDQNPSESDPLSPIKHVPNQVVDPEFIPPSSPRQTNRLSRQFN